MPSSQLLTMNDFSGRVDWQELTAALRRGHKQKPQHIDDTLLESGGHSLLNRSAWITGLGIGVKSVSVFPENPAQNKSLPAVHGIFTLFDDTTGEVRGMIDGAVLNYYKTAADSGLAASYLVRDDAQSMVIIGAGRVARSLLDAYSVICPQLTAFRICNRNSAHAEQLCAEYCATFNLQGKKILSAEYSPELIESSDVIATCTSSPTPVLAGEHVSAGTHVDLVGAFTPTMREADNDLLRKGRVFVDCRATTLEHIGEIMIPLESGVLSTDDILADFYDPLGVEFARDYDKDITVFKNGGGAHLDVMTADYLLGQLN